MSEMECVCACVPCSISKFGPCLWAISRDILKCEKFMCVGVCMCVCVHVCLCSCEEGAKYRNKLMCKRCVCVCVCVCACVCVVGWGEGKV